jgi:hypothetical protein
MARQVTALPNTTRLEIGIPAGLVRNVASVKKFGANIAVGTSFTPVCEGGIYRTPQLAGVTGLRVKAGGDANDTVAGTGARKIRLEGLDETGTFVQEIIDTAGASASSPSTTTFLRLFRAFVYESGRYASTSVGSHYADIVIEDAAGSEDWATIKVADFPLSQTEIGAYTVPLGYNAYVTAVSIAVDTTKATDVLFFKREGALKTAPPYDAMRLVARELGLKTSFQEPSGGLAWGPFPELTDFGFMAKVDAQTAAVEVEFDIVLEDYSDA